MDPQPHGADPPQSKADRSAAAKKAADGLLAAGQAAGKAAGSAAYQAGKSAATRAEAHDTK